MRAFDVAGLIQTLLLLSGDVELNPGPLTTGPLKQSDVSTVESELVGVATKWKELGIHLGLSSSTLDEIKQQGKEPLSCLHDVIEKWLLRADLFPMWSTITKALESLGEEELVRQLNDKIDGALSERQLHNRVRIQRPRLHGCGFETCNCLTLIDAGHSLERTGLPYFNPVSRPDGEAHREKLLLEHKEMLFAFQGLISTTWKSLARRSVTATTLVDYLASLEGTLPIGPPTIPLFLQIMGNLRDDQSVDEVFIDFHEYFSYFNNYLIRNILLTLGPTIENERALRKFEEKFRYFSQRKVVEASPLFMAPNSHGHCCVFVLMDRDPRKCNLTDVDLYRQRLSILIRLREYALRLIFIKMDKEGRMEMVYQFPRCLRPGLFPLSEQQEVQLKNDGILSFKCCDYEYNEPLDPDHEDEMPDGVPEGRQPADTNEEEDSSPPASISDLSNEAILERMMSSLSDTDFKMNLDQDSVTTSQLVLARPGMEGKNYISIVPNAQDKLVVFGLILSQHISHMSSVKKLARAVVVCSTKPRSEELHKELSNFFPKADIALFTGAEKDNMASKLAHLQPTIIVCTAGKLYRDLQSKTLDSITMLLIDDVHMALMNTSVRDVMQYYLRNKINHYELNGPHMVGVMGFSREGLVALTVYEMQDKLLNLAAVVDVNGGVSAPDNFLQGISPKDTTFDVTSFRYRDTKKDFVTHLAVEMSHLEGQCGFPCPFEKWSPEYSSFIQAHKDALLAVSTPDTISSHMSAVGHLDLLLCCAKAMNVCNEFGCEDAVQVLRRHSITESPTLSSDSPLKGVENALVMLQGELQKIVTRKNPVIEAVVEQLTSQFSQSPLSKGVLFVDSLKEGKFLCTEIKKHLYHVRPSVIDQLYVLRDIHMETDSSPTHEEEILKNFTRGECRLLIIPFPVEMDRDQLQVPLCNFILRLHQVTNTTTMVQAQYTLSLSASSVIKSCSKLFDDLQMVILEAVLSGHPLEKQTAEIARRRQGNLVQEYLSLSRFPYALPPRKKGKRTPPEKVILKCKQCRTFVCRGKDVFTLFADGGQFYVVPDRDFHFRFLTKMYRSKHKTIKRISRQHRMLCSNCDSCWGTICYFPARRCVLPVIKSKYFLFETEQKLLIVKVWQYAPFYVPPITTCSYFRPGNESSPSESE